MIGASGGVGSYAVQIATAYGAEVTGVASGAKADLVRSLGATRVIDYTREDLADGTRYDVILDIAGRRPLRSCADCWPSAAPWSSSAAREETAGWEVSTASWRRSRSRRSSANGSPP